MEIEVYISEVGGVRIEKVTVPVGTDAKAILGLLGLQSSLLGVFGRPVGPDTVLFPGDRLEIHRPLLLSPIERRKRQAEGKKLRRPQRSPKRKPPP